MTVTKPYTFSPGPAVSAEVNANFDTLYDALNNDYLSADGTVPFESIPSGPATDPTTDNQFTRKKYVDDKTKGVVKVPAVGMVGRVGTADGSTAQVLVQAGTRSAVTSGADIDVVFPQAFAGGVLSCVAVNGDANTGAIHLAVVTVTKTKATFRVFNASGSPLIGAAVRLDWVAVGW